MVRNGGSWPTSWSSSLHRFSWLSRSTASTSIWNRSSTSRDRRLASSGTFKRDLPVEPVIPRPEDLTHAAAADPLEDVVADRPVQLGRSERAGGLERLPARRADAPHPELLAVDLDITAASGVRTARAEQHRVATWAKGSGRRSDRIGLTRLREILGDRPGSCNVRTGKRHPRKRRRDDPCDWPARRRLSRAAAAGSAGRSPSASPARARTSSSTTSTSRARREKRSPRSRPRGRRGVLIQADLSRTDQARRLIDQAIEQLGPLDILVNNAGIEKRAPFVEVAEEDYDQVLAVNLKGAFFTTQQFVRHLLADKRTGKVINISSVHEEMPFPGYTTYCMSKGGLQLLTRNVAVEFGAYGITVNGIAPGAIATEINRALLDDKPRVDRLLKQIPLGRMGKPEDVAAVAAFLASSDADYVTGSTYYVDGGLAWDYRE